MKSTSIVKFMMSMIFILSMSISMAQETASVSEKIYQDYKKDGIEKALKNYEQTPAKGDEYTFQSEPLNQLGYRLMSEGDLDAAEKAFMAQIDEYPNEANPHDSYADLLVEKGEKEKAKKHYQKAIELAANIQDKDAKEQMLRASKPKLAQLENKGDGLKFLEGKWNRKTYGMENGEKTLNGEGSVEFKSNDNHTMLIGNMYNQAGKYMGSRIIAYDAMEDEYDMAYAGNSLTGIDTSILKIEKSTPEEVVMIEKFEENGNQMKIKHILKKKDGEIAWDIHDLSKGQSENQVAEMVFTRN